MDCEMDMDVEMDGIEWGGETQENWEESSMEEGNWEEFMQEYEETTHMILHGIKPTEGWYDSHFKYVYKYYQLDWNGLKERFQGKDNIMYELSVHIHDIIQELMNEYGGKPDFNFESYYDMLCSIHNLWTYYKGKYVGEEKDRDVIDIVEMMSFL